MSLNTVEISWDDQDRPVILVTYGDSDDRSAHLEPDEWLTELASRLPDKSAKFLGKLVAINDAQDKAISLADLAEELGVEKQVDGWNRNLGRSIKSVTREYGFLRKDEEDGTAQLFEFEWDGDNSQWLYIVPAKFRPALIAGLNNE